MNGKWSAGDETTVFESDWLTVSTAEVTMSDQTKIEHHFVRCGKGGAGVVVHDPEKGVLLAWRHRLTSNMWGWEIPGGRIESGEKPEATAIRETLEETGWQVGKLKPLITYQPVNGFLDHPFHIFYSESATWVGPSPDINEVGDLAWIPVDELAGLIAKGDISDGFTLTPLLFCLSVGPLAHHGHQH